MASYFESGFTALTELAKEKKAKQAQEELAKFQELKQKEKAEMARRIEAFADCA